MGTRSDFNIAVLAGDGIGHEIMDACLEVLRNLERQMGGFQLFLEPLSGGADQYRRTGIII